MKTYQWTVLAASVVGLACHVYAREQAVALDKLPPVVVEAVKKLLPNAELQRAVRHQEKAGDVEYRVTVQENSKHVDVVVENSGEIDEIAREIGLTELPKPVIAAIEARYPQSTQKKAAAIFDMDHGRQELDCYQVHVVTSTNQSIVVEVEADSLKVKQIVEKQKSNPPSVKTQQNSVSKAQSGRLVYV